MRESVAFRITRIVVLAIITLFVAAPLDVLVTSAFKPLKDVQGSFTWWPSHLTVQPFIDIWSTVPLARYFANSVIVSLSATVLSVVVAILAAYSVSRFTFRGSGLFKATVLSTQMFPAILFLIPLYLLFVLVDRASGLQLAGSQLGLVITYLTFSLPFSIWMLVGYFETIPRELDEAARVDGASSLRTLFQVVVPAATPGIVAVAIYAFMVAWGEILFASVLTTDESRTLAVGLREYASQVNVYWNEIMAASVVVSVPIVIAFLLLQRFLVAGFTSGAVK